MADGPTAVGLLGGRARRALTSVCGWKFGAKAGGRTSAEKWARMATLIETDPADQNEVDFHIRATTTASLLADRLLSLHTRLMPPRAIVDGVAADIVYQWGPRFAARP